MMRPEFSIAVFPFLKTRAPIQSVATCFARPPTSNTCLLIRRRRLPEIARMLFVQDDLRVKSASYAILPDIQVHSNDQRLTHLANLRAVVAYFYSAPHETQGSLFLSLEEASLALFTPDRVSVFLSRPEHHTESVAPSERETPTFITACRVTTVFTIFGTHLGSSRDRAYMVPSPISILTSSKTFAQISASGSTDVPIITCAIYLKKL